MYINKKQIDFKIFGIVIFSIDFLNKENQPRDILIEYEEEDEEADG